MLFLELAILVFFSFNLGKEMLKKNVIKNEVAALERELGQLEGEKNKLSDLLSYAQTDSFVESEARAKLNLAKEGESVLVIPEADRQLAQAGAPAGDAKDSDNKNLPLRKNNVIRWWEYFFAEDKSR